MMTLTTALEGVAISAAEVRWEDLVIPAVLIALVIWGFRRGRGAMRTLARHAGLEELAPDSYRTTVSRRQIVFEPMNDTVRLRTNFYSPPPYSAPQQQTAEDLVGMLMPFIDSPDETLRHIAAYENAFASESFEETRREFKNATGSALFLDAHAGLGTTFLERREVPMSCALPGLLREPPAAAAARLTSTIQHFAAAAEKLETAAEAELKRAASSEHGNPDR